MKSSPFSSVDDLGRRQFLTDTAQKCLGVWVPTSLVAGLAGSAAAAPAASTARAKSVIYLSMMGGMSHLDTFDPKPKAKEEQGPVEVIPTAVDDVFVSSHFSKTAKILDKVCVINSMTSKQGVHENGQYLMLKNYKQSNQIMHPSMGSWVMKLQGRMNESLPGFVSINGSPVSASGGYLGAAHSAVPIGRASEGMRNTKYHSDVSPEDFERRLHLARKLNREFSSKYSYTQLKSYDDLYDEALKLMKSEDLKAFDIQEESSAVRQMYGRNQFGQGCLLARRLVQHGVRFVEVSLNGWDSHYGNFDLVENKGRVLDQAYAALIADLDKNGLLDSTIVALNTEFGRTPEIVKHHNMGRDHHPAAFSSLLAGGGIKGGVKYGKTDAKGRRVRQNPVTHLNFNATIGHALGLPLEKVIYSPTKRPFTFSDGAKPVKELFG